MLFDDKELKELDLSDPSCIYLLIVKYLCGKQTTREAYEHLPDHDRKLLEKFIQHGTLSFAQVNELLLLLGQNRLSLGFYEFFFAKPEITLSDLRSGITEFRGLAMLCFGNFRFPFREFSNAKKEEIERAFEKHCCIPQAQENKYKSRPTKALETEPIDPDKTWYAGYISAGDIEFDQNEISTALDNLAANQPSTNDLESLGREGLLQLADKYSVMEEERKETARVALKNTEVYLTWDYMDVYIATSMRYRSEYEDTAKFIEELFGQEPLKSLNLRFFDPTQSLCLTREDKGLVEGLMLRRAACTIYMAQEYDTMGKDSELAATLAQGKPVIAYVPNINVDSHMDKIRTYPLSFFLRRFLILQGEAVFERKSCREELEALDPAYLRRIDEFLVIINNYLIKHRLRLWEEAEERVKTEHSKLFEENCRILAIAEKHNMDNRARTFSELHPLGLQVDLSTGVANGVLVVRATDDVAKLLAKLLTNDAQFEIRHDTGDGWSMTRLIESEFSQCTYRVVTGYERLTNSFWNFYRSEN